MGTKRNFIRHILACAFVTALVFSAPHLALSAQPGLDVDLTQWGTLTWTGNPADPFTGLSHGVKIFDYDGIAPDGSSHTVTVTYPNGGPTKTVWFSYRIDDNSAVYEMYDGDIIQPIDPGTYSGTYVYRVTDLSSSEWNEATDEVLINPISPPDESTFSPNFGSPQSITAHFDDMYVNGAFYDDFETGFDPTKWQWQPPEVTYENGEVRFEQDFNPGRGSQWMNITNPEGVNAIQATVRVDSVTSNLPRARIAGNFCHDDYGEVFAQLGLRGSEAVYGADTERWEGNHLIAQSLVPLTSLGPVTQGNNYQISIDWDGATFTFRVIGLDDAVDYTATYTPSGSITPPDDPWKGIGLGCWLILDSTTPTFDWDEIPGAKHYRVRIYGFNDAWIYTACMKSPPYTLPPGILKPNALYKYRIYAQGDHQWFEADNAAGSDRNKTRFSAGPEEAEKPYVDLASNGASTWTGCPTFGTHTWFYIKIHDAQGVPGNIASVKALLPDGVTEVNLYLSYNETPTCGIYQGAYFGATPSGMYTFTVVDKNGNSDTKTEVLTPDPIAYPSEGSLQPANNAVLGETGVSFNWDNVPEAAFYELYLYDKDLNYLNINYIKRTESEILLPSGILRENSLYRYRVFTRREFFEDNVDNGSSAPHYSSWYANTFFTTETHGTAPPSLNLDSFGVAVWHAPHPATGESVYWLEFGAMVTDPDGVPENIERVEVTYPDGSTKLLLRFLDNPDWGHNYYGFEIFTDPASIPSGIYTFQVVDFDDHDVSLTDSLPGDVASHILPWPTGVTPPDGTILNNTTPTITWDIVPGASYYKVSIMSAWNYPRIHWSEELTQTQYTVPAGILAPYTTYGYRVYAYREPSGSEIDFYACNRSLHETNFHFTTGEAECLPCGDVNLDDDLTPGDALLAFQHYLAIADPPLDACQLDQADVTQEGEITPADALCIFQKFLGIPSCLDDRPECPWD